MPPLGLVLRVRVRERRRGRRRCGGPNDLFGFGHPRPRSIGDRGSMQVFEADRCDEAGFIGLGRNDAIRRQRCSIRRG